MVLLILNSLFSLIIILVTAWPDLENKNKNPLKRLNKKGLTVVIFGIFSVLIQIIQYNLSENQQQFLRNENKKALYEQDSIAQIREDSTVSKVVSSFADGFARYGLKYDTAKQEFEKLIRDSARKTIINVHPPSLDVCPQDAIKLIDKSAGKYTFKVKFCSTKAPAKNFIYKLLIATVPITLEDTFYFKKPIEIKKGDYSDLPDNIVFSSEFFYKIPGEVESSIFWFDGSYEDIFGKKYKFHRLLILKHQNGEIQIPFGDILRELETNFYDVSRSISK